MNTASQQAEKVALTPKLLAYIKQWQNKPGNLIMVLHRIQEHFGYVPRSVAVETAALLKVPLAKIYGILTFYHLFKLQKLGKNRIAICFGTACYLKGSEDIIQEIEKELQIGVNSVTPDGEFSLEVVRCIGCCGLAPTVMVNGEVHGKLKAGDIAGILAKYRGK